MTFLLNISSVEVKGRLLEKVQGNTVVPHPRNRNPVKEKTQQNALLEAQLKALNKESEPAQTIIQRTPLQDKEFKEMIKSMYAALADCNIRSFYIDQLNKTPLTKESNSLPSFANKGSALREITHNKVASSFAI